MFNEAKNPKRDYVIGISPELTVFSRMGMTQFAASAISDFVHYFTYDSERSTTTTLRGRFDLNLSRFHPSIAGATNSAEDRPNDEIDTRARRREMEAFGARWHSIFSTGADLRRRGACQRGL